jgi:hypothetical protein
MSYLTYTELEKGKAIKFEITTEIIAECPSCKKCSPEERVTGAVYEIDVYCSECKKHFTVSYYENEG